MSDYKAEIEQILETVYEHGYNAGDSGGPYTVSRADRLAQSTAKLAALLQSETAKARLQEQSRTTLENGQIVYVVADHIVTETVSQADRIKQLQLEVKGETSNEQ